MRTYATAGACGVAFVAVAGTWACGGGGDGGGTAPPTTGTVTGQVNRGGSAAVGVVTHLRVVGAGTDAKPAQATNAQGRYTFTAVQPGDYRVFVDLADSLAADPGPAEDTVTVQAGMTATAATFELRLLVGAVQGTIRDTVPAPLQGRTAVLRKVGSTAQRTAATNVDGEYSFTSVSAGDYTVDVQITCGELKSGAVPVTVTDAATATAAAIEVTPRPSEMLLSCDVQPIFTRTCAAAGCHSGSAPQENLNLSSAAQTLQTAVNVASTQRAPLRRIKPLFADQDSSYLVCKIEAVCGNRFGVRMPEGCADAGCLSLAQIDTIKQWIDAGAPNN